jgi:hypothetical protein
MSYIRTINITCLDLSDIKPKYKFREAGTVFLNADENSVTKSCIFCDGPLPHNILRTCTNEPGER